MKTNFKRIGRQSLSIVLAVMMMVSTLLVGTVTSNASGTYTVYFTPDNSWTTAKVNCNRGQSNDNWYNFTAEDTGKTINGQKVYKADLDLPEDGVKKMEFNDGGSNWKAVINNSWTNASVFSGKYYSGNFGSGSWVDPQWDGEQPTQQVSNVVYLKNTADWKESIFAYIWGDSGSLTEWANAVQMTYVATDTDGKKIYKYENDALSKYNKIIFRYGSNGTSSASSCDQQTGDLTLNLGKMYNNSNKTWETYTPPVTGHKVNVTSSNAVVTVNDTEVASGSSAEVAENADYAITAKAADGYFITEYTVGDTTKSYANGDFTYDQAKGTLDLGTYTMGSADVDVNVKAALIVKPTVTLTGSNAVNFGNSVTLTPDVTYNADLGDVTVAETKYDVKSNVESATATVTDNVFTVAKALGENNDNITFTVTYTVTLSNGESGSAELEITATDSQEQKAYKSLKSGLGSTYPDPDTLTGYTSSTLNAYTDAYNSAKTVVAKGYPDASGTENTNALSAIETAYNALDTVTTLVTPVLGVDGSTESSVKVASGTPVTLKLTNSSAYTTAGDNVTFKLYKEGQETAVATLTSPNYSFDAALNLAIGENKFYIVAESNSDKYVFTATKSEYFTVNVVEMHTVTVSDSENGSVAISAYTDIDGNEQTTTEKSVSAMAGKPVKFTATANTGYELDKLTVINDTTKAEITANEDGSYTMPSSNVTVSATFKKASHTLTYTAPTGSNVVSESITAQGSVEYGTEVTVIVTTKDNYTASLEIEGVDVSTFVEGNTYTFKFTMPNNDITVAPKAAQKESPKRVYVKNTANWGSVNIYVWDTSTGKDVRIGNAWPGQKMTLVEGKSDIYYYELPSRYDATNVKLIFSNNGASQTDSKGFLYSDYVGQVYINGESRKTPFTYVPKVTADNATVTFSGSGVAKDSDGNTTINENSDYSVTVTPADGYRITKVTVNGDEQTIVDPSGENTFTGFTMGVNNATIVVETEQIQKYSVNIAQYDADKGNVSISPSQSLAQGETFEVNVAPKTGYYVSKITVKDADDNEITAAEGKYTMPASDVTVTVQFALNQHTLTFTEPTENVGNVTISQTGSVFYGTKVSVVVNVKNGYEAALDLGDVEVSTTIVENQYTFNFVMPDKDITVAPTVSAKGVPTPVISLGAAVATGGTLKAYVNEPKSITATVGLPEGADGSYVKVDTDRTGYVQEITFKGADGTTKQLDINKYIVPANSLLENTTTFKFDEVGTYQITYNGALVSTVDSTKTSSANATLTVDVTYSATQQSYLDLKELTDDTTNYPASVSSEQYTSGVDEYNTARANAQTAVDNGFPAYDDEDIYTALNEALVNAKNSLVAAKEFYIGGSFKTSTVDNSTWAIHPNNIKFEQVSSNLYKVETNLNINANKGFYFYVYSKSGTFYKDYGVQAGNTLFNGKTSLSNSQTLTNTGYDNHQLYFNNNVASAPNAVMWLDTSGLADDGTGSMKLFYTSGVPTAKYSLTGGDSKGAKVDWASGWNTYDAQYTVNEPTDNPFVFSKTIVVNDENGAYFRINTSSAQYGPATDQTAVSSVKSTTITTTNNAFKIPSGSYRLFVDQSGTTPVIWISQADYTVSAMGIYTFNGTSYNPITQTEKPAITVSDTTVAAGQAVTVSATNDFDGYEFTGWTSTNGTFANVSSLETTFTPNADNAVAIARYAKKLSVSVSLAEGSNDGTWTIGEVTANAATYRAGSVVSVSFTPSNADDIITSVTVEGKEYVTSLEDNKLNLTVGVTNEDDTDVKVVVTFAERPKYNYGFDFVSGCESMGNVVSLDNNGKALDQGEYPYGTEITLRATANDGYVFKGWYSDINGTGDCLSTDATYKFTLTESIDVFAKFAEDSGTMISGLYLIYSDSSSNPSDYTKYLNLYYDSNNQVYAYFDNSIFDDSKTYRFMISTSAGTSTSWESAYENSSNRALSDSDHLSCGNGDWWLSKSGTYENINVHYAKFNVLDDFAGTISSVKVNIGYYNGTDIVESATDSTKAYTYEVIPNVTGTVSPRVKIYAKDGTIRSGYQKYADMADTDISYSGDDVTKKTSTTYTVEGYAKLGSTITVTTTIADAYKDTYYVKAFSVNGYSYGIIDSSKANADGVYSFDYTIPEGCTDKFIEITPIYYYIDDTDTVTFYVEGFDDTVQAQWGNTVAVQAWYKNGTDTGSSTAVTKNALGGYPGQPLVYEGGKYSMQIPKYLNGDTTNRVSGITLNNYIWDDVHKHNFSSQINDNAQTYDYDDFYKLSDTADVDNIIFDFRYRTTTDNKPSQDGLSSSTYNKNELENLTDYYGNIVDIFGNILSEKWDTDYDSQYLTVISDGYKNNYIGKYATEWSVYDHDGKYITTINCSNLIDENKVDTSYQPAYNALKPYANLPVKIAYEKSIFNGPDKGDRADGRWYFSKKAQKITANVQIQYRTDDNSPFIEDPFVTDSNIGTTTGTSAYFTNADYNGKTTCEGEVDGGNFSVHADTDADANYYFIGWYLKTSDGYAFITSNPTADFPMTNNETYVARFIPTPSGTLTLSHTLLTGSAQGMTYISAKIVNKTTGKEIASIAETSGNLVVPSRYVTYPSSYNINVTLRTVPYGNDTVEGFYEGYSADTPTRYDASFEGSGEKIYNEISRDIESLFKQDTDAEGNVSYSLIKSNVPFYSNIVSQPLDYKITYKYKSRFDDPDDDKQFKEYVVKDTVSGIELQEMWAANEAAGLTKEQLSKAFITKKAPFVSNFRNEIKWNIDNAVINGYTATVNAATDTSDLTITALAVDGTWTAPATLKYGELAVSNGEYLYKTGTTEFPDTIKYSTADNAPEYELSYWAIFDNRDSAQQFSNAVKNYMANPNADMSVRLTDLSQLDGYKNLVAKSYSKEYNYVSYQNYYIVPVYADRFGKDDITEAQASIRLLEYTRNQWTTGDGVKGDGETLNTGASKTDYLYTDFALSFDKDQELIKNNANIKVGIAFEIVAKYDNVDLKTYVTDSDTDTIGTTVKNAKANGKVGSYTFDGANRNIYRYEIDNSTISVKNRIEYYLQFKNTSNARQNVLKVYSYIYDTVSGEIYLSDPVYMNMYDIGNLTYITSDLANINLGPDATV